VLDRIRQVARPRGWGKPEMELEVLGSQHLAPHMVSVTFGGPGLAGFQDNGFTDRYVKLVFPRPDGSSVLRTYTVRAHDPAAGTLRIDFVHHGDAGVAGPWAAACRPGDTITVRGPGGAYRPDLGCDWHLLVGDASALPAIAAALEAVPEGRVVRAVVALEHGADRQELVAPPGTEVRWLCADEGDGGFAAHVAAMAFPAGRPDVFAHGELGEVKELRRHLTLERGLDRAGMSVSAYWRRGADEDAFQAAKRSGDS
jgi:NADPH-dependent ferric siderophore reductase